MYSVELEEQSYLYSDNTTPCLLVTAGLCKCCHVLSKLAFPTTKTPSFLRTFFFSYRGSEICPTFYDLIEQQNEGRGGVREEGMGAEHKAVLMQEPEVTALGSGAP